jgi:hypothetical protein
MSGLGTSDILDNTVYIYPNSTSHYHPLTYLIHTRMVLKDFPFLAFEVAKGQQPMANVQTGLTHLDDFG